jgi:hypothetical protein
MNAIIILGMYRSGTSLVAGLLHRLGVFMGEDFGNNSDPWHHYEDQAFVSLNQQLLTSAGGSWRKPPSVQALFRSSHPYNERIQRLLRERFKAPPWGFKDPSTCLTAPLWHSHLLLWGKPRYVIVWRERERVVASLIQRAKVRGDGTETGHLWYQLVGNYWGRVVDFHFLHHPSHHAVWYEELTNPEISEKVIHDLADFCQVSFNQDALSFIEVPE